MTVADDEPLVFEFAGFAPAADEDLNFTPTLPQLTNSIRRSTRTLRNRLRSIAEDASFVSRVHDAYALPVVANARAGEWYVDPAAPERRQSVYFKSTDGHTGQYGFSLRRLNLGLLDVVAEADGAIIVDSTRRGKRFPDALSKTLPIWTAVLNSALFPTSPPSPPELHTTPLAVSPSEHAHISALLPGFLREFHALGLDLDSLQRKLRKPLRPLFVTPASPLPESPPRFAEFTPLVLVTASKLVASVGTEGEYIQGAGDDHEGWTAGTGLTPALFWQHRDALLKAHDDGELAKALGALGLQDSSGQAPVGEVTLVAPTKNIFIASQAAARTAAVDVIVDCSETPLGECDLATVRPFPIPAEGKRGNKVLRTKIGTLLPSLQDDLQHGKRVLFACATGDAVAPAVALVLLCLYCGEAGPWEEVDRAGIDKTFIRRRLAWISAARPSANPSRSLLQAVNSVLMEWR